jgi:hypothetical protein
MTKTEWDRRETLRLKLAELLEQEPLKEALQVCLSLETEAPQHFVGSADLLHQADLSGASREGYFRFYRNLKALTKESAKPSEMPEPWAHLRRPTSE